jgi:hypothetical protein
LCIGLLRRRDPNIENAQAKQISDGEEPRAQTREYRPESWWSHRGKQPRLLGFVTLTSVGYGDIILLHPLARVLQTSKLSSANFILQRYWRGL